MRKLLLEVFQPNDNVIIDYVKNKRYMAIMYKGDKEKTARWRKIQPLCFGEKNGNKYLRAWQQEGNSVTGTPNYKLFRLDRIRNWNLNSSQNFFKVPDTRFNPNGDKLMDKIYAIADFNPGDKEPPSEPISPNPKKPKPGQDKGKSKTSLQKGKPTDKLKNEPEEKPKLKRKPHYASQREPKEEPKIRLKGSKDNVRENFIEIINQCIQEIL